MLIYIGLGLAGGALAFAHCLGMCGGFALHLAQAPSRWGVLGRQLLWHAGRTFTYVFLGAMGGFVGSLAGAASALPWLQKALACAAGAAMVLMGMAILGLLPRRTEKGDGGRGTRDDGKQALGSRIADCGLAIENRKSKIENDPSSSGTARSAADGLLSSVFRQFFREPTPAGGLALGLATGFLPCPIVIGFLSLSVASGSVLTGMATMAAMGVGTVWPLLLLGMSGHLLTVRLRRWSAAVAGAVLILLGAATMLRGTEGFHRILGCPRAPAIAGAAEGPMPAPGKCCCGKSESR